LRFNNLKVDMITYTKDDKVFKGNPLFSSIGLTIIIFIVLIFFIVPDSDNHLNNHKALIILIIPIGLILLFSYKLYYFILTDDQLIIRNHVFIWIQRTYNLNNIETFVIEQQYKQAIALKIIDKNLDCKAYQADSLKKRVWRELIKELEGRNFEVNNTAFK